VQISVRTSNASCTLCQCFPCTYPRSRRVSGYFPQPGRVSSRFRNDHPPLLDLYFTTIRHFNESTLHRRTRVNPLNLLCLFLPALTCECLQSQCAGAGEEGPFTRSTADHHLQHPHPHLPVRATPLPSPVFIRRLYIRLPGGRGAHVLRVCSSVCCSLSLFAASSPRYESSVSCCDTTFLHSDSKALSLSAC
jgi:hypothetical protein